MWDITGKGQHTARDTVQLRQLITWELQQQINDWSSFWKLVRQYLIPAWISNCIHYKVCDEITNLFPNFNEIWERISNFITHNTEYNTGPNGTISLSQTMISNILAERWNTLSYKSTMTWSNTKLTSKLLLSYGAIRNVAQKRVHILQSDRDPSSWFFSSQENYVRESWHLSYGLMYPVNPGLRLQDLAAKINWNPLLLECASYNSMKIKCCLRGYVPGQPQVHVT